MKQLFYVEHAYQLMFLKPVILQSIKDGHQTAICCPRDLEKYARAISDSNILQSERYKPNKLIRKFDFLYKKYTVPFTYSSMYYRKYAFHGINRVDKVINVLLAGRHNYNIRYVRTFRLFYYLGLTPVFEEDFDKIHLCTKLSNTILFVGYSEKLVTYQESWDHPQKGPYFFVSSKHFCWPNLMQTTKRHQPDIGEIVQLEEIYKFTYTGKVSNELPGGGTENFIEKHQGEYLLYPVCTSSTYHNVNKSELRFLEILITLCKEENLPLFIRPYPLAPRKDLLAINTDSDLIFIDSRSTFKDGHEVFNANAINNKLYQIKNARAVVNIGTTFVFDAAALNRPVVQLRLGAKFGTVSEISDYEHISSFLNNDLKELMDYEELKDFIVSNIDSLEKTKRLRDFLNLK